MLVTKNCLTCNEPFQTREDFVKRGKGLFCSKRCSKLGSNNPAWNGGTKISDKGYILIYMPEHPDSMKAGYIFEHRLIMENKLGRRLQKEELVHHKNHIKSDNRPENLMLLSRVEHKSLHNQGNKIWLGRKHSPASLQKLRQARINYWKDNVEKIKGKNNPNYKHGKYSV